LQHLSQKYPEDSFLAGCHSVVEIEGKIIEVALDAAKWTKVMDADQWEIHPSQPVVCAVKDIDSYTVQYFVLQVTKAALDDFKPGRGLPSCVLEARPRCEDFPQLLYQLILNGIKPPHHKIILSYMPSRTNKGTVSLVIIMMALFFYANRLSQGCYGAQRHKFPRYLYSFAYNS
jgi:hypothetical protein